MLGCGQLLTLSVRSSDLGVFLSKVYNREHCSDKADDLLLCQRYTLVVQVKCCQPESVSRCVPI